MKSARRQTEERDAQLMRRFCANVLTFCQERPQFRARTLFIHSAYSTWNFANISHDAADVLEMKTFLVSCC